MDKRPDSVKRLPAILITGFLGAGKTTLLNNLTGYLDSAGYRSAILLNEFGKINIDKELMKDISGSIYEVNQGSVFCACTRGQFLSAVKRITGAKPPFDIAVIEATGIAKTGDFGKYLDEAGLYSRIRIAQNFCIIDAGNFHKVFKTLPAVENQVRQASVCVINKIDTVSGDYLEELSLKLFALNPKAVIVKAEYAAVDFNNLIDLYKNWSSGEQIQVTPPENIESVTIFLRGRISEERAAGFIKDYEGRLLRAKGFIYTEEGVVYLEYASGKITASKPEKPYSGPGVIVFIGYGLDQAAMRKELMALYEDDG